jgi:hypothetical protein
VNLMSQTATIVTSFDRLRNGKEVVPGRSEPEAWRRIFFTR